MNFSESENLKETKIDPSLFNLFCIELETQCSVLSRGLIDLEKHPENFSLIDSLMRAAHSIKGAARIVNLQPLADLAHAMEDYFVSIHKINQGIHPEKINQLFQCVDLFKELSESRLEKIHSTVLEKNNLFQFLIGQISSQIPFDKKPPKDHLIEDSFIKNAAPLKSFKPSFKDERILRVTARNLNRLMGLAGETLVESRGLYPFEEGLLRLKKIHNRMERSLDLLRGSLRDIHVNEQVEFRIHLIYKELEAAQSLLMEKFNELDQFTRSHLSLSHRLYQEAIDSRMRPFEDVVEGLPRLVRDLSQQLGKAVRLEVEGLKTAIDRDILEKLESPLSHLLRNAIDHGIETPRERALKGKPEEGLIHLEARHIGGMLAITISDDGRGIDSELIRKIIVKNHLAEEQQVNQLTEAELFDFLFLPGFSTSSTVSDISGRGVGLNAVLEMVREVSGSIKISSALGKGTSFFLRLPLTLSVIRALIVNISGEPYAFPLARIDRVLTVDSSEIEWQRKQPFYVYEDQAIPLIETWKILELNPSQLDKSLVSLVIVHREDKKMGLIVDSLRGEKELAVQDLDPRLDKISDIIAGAIMEDGSPLLVVNVDEMIESIENFLKN